MNNIKKYLQPKRIASLVGQLLVMLLVVVIVTQWQTRNLVEKGEAVPDVTLYSLKGEEVKLSSFKGKKIIIYFFATWCSVCSLTSSNVESVFRSVDSDDTQVFAVALSWQNPEQVKKTAEKHGLTMPVLLGSPDVQKAFRIEAFPTFYFIDTNGIVSNYVTGYTTRWGIQLRSYIPF